MFPHKYLPYVTNTFITQISRLKFDLLPSELMGIEYNDEVFLFPAPNISFENIFFRLRFFVSFVDPYEKCQEALE